MKSTKTRNQVSAEGRVTRREKQEPGVDFRVAESLQCQSANPVDGGSRQDERGCGPKSPGKSSTKLTKAFQGRAIPPRRVASREKLPGPRTRPMLNWLRALRLVNRFRQLRAIDLVAGLFPGREFKAGLSAAQRLTKSLVALRMLHRYRSLSGQTYYALGEAGARWLRQNGSEDDGDASASASRVCEKTNPEHDLWAAFIVLACEARGLWARAEKELLPTLFDTGDLRQRKQVLVVSDERGQPKGLLPDAIAVNARGAIWFEVDRSERGSGRLADLRALMKSFGTRLYLGSEQRHNSLPLRQVVVLCKTERILRRHVAHLTGRHPTTGEPRLRLIGGEPALRQVVPGVFN
ncbi:hypothetical protein WDZ92_42340, partial [Nostoc sp. NIES-2111]